MGNQLIEDRAQFSVNAWHCAFTVHGNAVQGGSKRIGRTRGSNRPIILDDNPKTKNWKQEVQILVGTLMRGRDPYEGPLTLEVTFYRPRPASHYGRRGLKPSAPRYPTVKPDTTKLLRPFEDALTGIIWRDDSQVVDQHVKKRYCPAEEEPRVEVRVSVML